MIPRASAAAITDLPWWARGPGVEGETRQALVALLGRSRLADVSDEADVVLVALAAFGVRTVFCFGVEADSTGAMKVGA